MLLKDKVAIVTGGASGIGLATVKEMLAQGARVVAADINDKDFEPLSSELNTDGAMVVFQKTDATDEAQVEAMIQRAVTEFGKLDILFNNAGIGYVVPTEELPYEQWKKLMSINLDAVFLGTKHAIPVMKQNGGGAIVNTASIMGIVGQAGAASYNASKGGVIMFTKSLAIEYAKENIRVNAVCPGYVKTPLLESAPQELLDQLISLHPVGRLAEPAEIAKCVVFLASDYASFVTGSALVADGGYTAQ